MRAFCQTMNRQCRLKAGIKLIAAAVVLASAPTAFSQLDGSGNYDEHGILWTPWNPDDWTRRFHLGAVVGFNIGAKFNMSGNFGISGNNPAAGIYDDGYVHPDNSGAGDGYTSNWGYNNASQYNAAKNTLTMDAVTGFTVTGSNHASEDAGPTPGIDLAYSAYVWHAGHFGIGWELGFDWMPITISDNNPISGTVNLNTYVYDTGGIVVPDPPYQGGSSGTGPLIPLPDNPPTPTTTTSDATITGSRSLDLNLYIFRLGPTINLDLGKDFSVAASFGPAMGIVDGDYQFNEHIFDSASGTTTQNKGQFGSTELVYGGYVNASLIYHLPNSDGRADLYLSTQFMPLSSATYKGDGREGKLELSGQMSISIGVNWPF